MYNSTCTLDIIPCFGCPHRTFSPCLFSSLLDFVVSLCPLFRLSVYNLRRFASCYISLSSPSAVYLGFRAHLTHYLSSSHRYRRANPPRTLHPDLSHLIAIPCIHIRRLRRHSANQNGRSTTSERLKCTRMEIVGAGARYRIGYVAGRPGNEQAVHESPDSENRSVEPREISGQRAEARNLKFHHIGFPAFLDRLVRDRQLRYPLSLHEHSLVYTRG